MNKVFPIITGEDAKKVQQALEEAKHPKEGTIQYKLQQEWRKRKNEQNISCWRRSD